MPTIEMTRTEACFALGISTKTLHARINRGELARHGAAVLVEVTPEIVERIEEFRRRVVGEATGDTLGETIDVATVLRRMEELHSRMVTLLDAAHETLRQREPVPVLPRVTIAPRRRSWIARLLRRDSSSR